MAQGAGAAEVQVQPTHILLLSLTMAKTNREQEAGASSKEA